MSMGSSIQGNQNLVGASKLPAVMPKSFDWGQKLADLGRRLSELLQIKKSPKGLDDDQMYFGM